MSDIMIFETFVPQKPLADFVSLFWHCRESATRRGRERRLPSATLELVISLGEDRLRVFDAADGAAPECYPGAVIGGPHSKYIMLDSQVRESSIGIHFKPGGAFPFLRVPIEALHNRNVPLEALWGRGAAKLRQRLMEASTPALRFGILERELLARMAPASNWHPAVALGLRTFQSLPQQRSVADVAEMANLSPRRFIELFRSQVGLTPKLFCRISRFQHALRLAAPGRAIQWTDLALCCGYFDQAHLIRDFREFSGLSPTAYLARRGGHQNHVPLSPTG